MKVFKDLSGNYRDVIDWFFSFESYEDDYEDFLLVHGEAAKGLTDPTYDKRIFFNQEHPCSFTLEQVGYDSLDLSDQYTHILSICPYTCEWANELIKSEKFHHVLFPIDDRFLSLEKIEKDIDIIYCGSPNRMIIQILKRMSKFKYEFCSLGRQFWTDGQDLSYLLTKINIPSKEKYDLIGRTKIMPIVNQLFLSHQHVENIKSYSNYQNNKAFSHIHEGLAPQLKPRITEAALLRCLMLVKRDPWNVIEYWYTPDEDFIYFDDYDDFEEKAEHILQNYKQYEDIIESAHKKAVNNCLTSNWLDRIEKLVMK